MSLQFTDEQQAVISAEPANLLVAAAAGSGKTAVLTERIVRRIQAQQLDVQHMLVVTFTEAAARQMREKIEEKLLAARQHSQDAAQRRYLSRQLALLPAAAISTIHAFCLQVIRNFYPLTRDEQGRPLVEPGFSVQDRGEADLLLRQVLDEWMNTQYEAIDRQPEKTADLPASIQAFYRLTDGYGDSRSDRPVRELILRVFHFLRSLPDYPSFARDKLAVAVQAAGDFSKSRYCRTLMDQLHLRLDRAGIVLPDLQDLLEKPIRLLADQNRNQAARQGLRAALSALVDLQALMRQDHPEWDQVRLLARPLEQLDLPRSSGRDPEDKQRFLDLFARYVAEAVCFLTGRCGTQKYRRHFLFQTEMVFDKSEAEITAEIQEMLPAVERFIELVIGLDEQYTIQKRQAGVIDFSDFEHLALLVLRQEEAQRYYRERFHEIYIDEYQDTSSIQEAILQAVGQDKTVMVGDIKQSIYRFRHARPQIFRAKAARYENRAGGRLLQLSRNFRSIRSLLSTVNDVFAQLMSVGAGEIDYDHLQGLAPHRPDPVATEERAVQVLLLDRAAEPADEEEDVADPLLRPDEMNRYEQEALLVLTELHRLHANGCNWCEMVILARTRNILSAYREQLEAGGVPTTADMADEALNATVLRQLDALLQLLDNRHQDIPLAAVMHGGIWPDVFTLDELTLIHLFGRQQKLERFHEAVPAYAKDGPDEAIRQRVTECLAWIDALRAREQVLRIGELIGLLYTETGWLDRVAAEVDGQQNVRLLRQFQAWAEQYEFKRPKGLYQFARYLESLQAQDRADTPVEPAAVDEDRVRLMTLHGSKGLEFPVVFLVGTSGPIGRTDTGDHILFSESMGIGFDYADPARQIRYPTHLKLAMQEEIQAAVLAEEMRLLYVAMTRAMDRLYLVGTVSLDPLKGAPRLWEQVEQARNVTGRRLPDHLVRSARCYLEWIILALARNPLVDLSFLAAEAAGESAGQALRQAPADEQPAAEDMPGLERFSEAWSVVCRPLDSLHRAVADLLHQQAALGQTSRQQAETAAAASDPEDFSADDLQKRIFDPYRFDQAARTPVKLTVSELKQRNLPDDPDRQSSLPATDGQTRLILSDDRALPYRGIDLTLRPSERPPASHTSALVIPADVGGGAHLGTALHAVLRYLDLPAARRQPAAAEVERQLDAMQTAGMLSGEDRSAVQSLVPALLRFVCSDLAGDLVAAMNRGEVQQEIPFTLALPACRVYPDCGGLAPDDQVMVQGIIDCWYRDQSGITLIDYKSDAIFGTTAELTAILTQRYAEQLGWYAHAIRTVTGSWPRRCLIWHIRSGLAIPLARDTWQALSKDRLKHQP